MKKTGPLLALSLLGCDHASKHVAQGALRGRPAFELWPGVLDLRYAENRDVGFNLLSAIPEGPRRWAILLFGVAAICLLAAFWMRRRGAPTIEQLGFALILSGALGNLIDRAARGYVVDFIHLHHWPIFNVADVCICLGAAALVLTWRAQVQEPALR